MTKYDNLDSRRELEQTITGDLKKALEKRGFNVQHNGTLNQSAPANVPDIEAWTQDTRINIEVTKTTKSSADREMPSISDHLNKTKASHPKQMCYAIYVSPETHYRAINAIHDYNIARPHNDQKIMPFSFSTFELLAEKLAVAHKSLYDEKQIVHLFSRYNEFTDDDNILRIVFQELFSTDNALKKEIDDKEILKHSKIEQDLFSELRIIENKLRESGIAVAGDAVKNMIYLVFMKLFEEKQEMLGGKNYFTSDKFIEFQQAQGQTEKRQAIHRLFEIIRDQSEFQETRLFTKTDHLAEPLNDDFVLESVIKPLEEYRFYVTKVDGLGAAYEVLALRSSKDVKVGQFFTPKHVVQFMVKLAQLDPTDLCLDPACGTGRFLIWAMDYMLDKVSGKNAEEMKQSIRLHQLMGADIDPNVAKLAKMNMYIHGDGKANIWEDDGLLLYKTRGVDNTIDAILTNPPLGRMNYRKSDYDEEFLKRMTVIPRSKVEKSDVSESSDESEITGNLMKGGALFVNACSHYLKPIRDTNKKIEWRGGKLLIILDEGILNTDDYRETRQFIRQNYYIKAIISLTTDTFVPVSKTPTKTSILYAIKKDDTTAVQQEPIFYAHAEKVGMDTKKRPCPNHLLNEKGEDILSKFLEFKAKVEECYDGDVFNKKKFETLGLKGGMIA